MLAVSANITNADAFFAIAWRLIIMPMFLFSGTFYPLSSLPLALQWIGWISPLWHATQLGRWLSYGMPLEPWQAMVSIVYLLAMGVVGIVLARRRFEILIPRNGNATSSCATADRPSCGPSVRRTKEIFNLLQAHHPGGFAPSLLRAGARFQPRLPRPPDAARLCACHRLRRLRRSESGEMMGAVRLHADANHETGEYGILLRSDLKGLGLGWELMRLMIEWAKVEGLREIDGQVLRENSTMLDMCRSLGFSIKIDRTIWNCAS